MKVLVISNLNLMRALINNALSKFGITQINLNHKPSDITALLGKELVHLVIVHEQDHLSDTLADLSAVFGSGPGTPETTLKCILVRKNNSFQSEELKAYKDFVLQGKLTILLTDHLERTLISYFEHHLHRTISVYQENHIERNNLSILLVDDSAIFRKQLARELVQRGYSVVEAEDGCLGWEAFEEFSPAIVVTDICMPNMSGIELCQKIKERNAYTEVIVISSMNHQETADLVFETGADDFLIKPFDLSHLVLKIDSIISTIIEKSRYRVLIVDDDPFIKENLRRAFKKNSMEVLMASNGLEGFSMAMVEKPAIIITDIEMPVMDGYELLVAVKSVHQLEPTTLIMMSGKFAKGKVKMSTNHAPIQFFAKPIDLDKMVMLTEQLIINKSLQSSKEYDLMISSIMALVTALEERDAYTMGHSERVKTYSLLIGSRLGVAGPQLKTLELASSLHDLGKIGIRDDVLLKPGKLSDQEFETIKEHPCLGSKILSTIESLSYIATIILHHHERFDGKGYPQGISGKRIPLESRIIAVADTFDAVTSSRPYRKIPMTVAEAENLLGTLAGTQLCPDCVKAFLAEQKSEDVFIHDAVFVPPPMVFEMGPVTDAQIDGSEN